MQILHLNTFDNFGGAAVACRRLNSALHNAGINSKILVAQKDTVDKNILLLSKFAKYRLREKLFREKFGISFADVKDEYRYAFSLSNTGFDLSKNELVKQAYIINLHWTNVGFLSLKNLQQIFKLGKPIVWTLHDMWSFTGGCHHAYECENYQRNCGNCFYLKKSHSDDLSAKIHSQKKQIYANTKINVVSVSNWLKNRAEKSSLFADKKHLVIPNSIDTDFFSPQARNEACQKLNLNPQKKYLVMGAAKLNDKIKGFKYLIDALNILNEKYTKISENLELVLFGDFKNDTENLQAKIPLKFHLLGTVSPQLLPTIYSASELCVQPSLYETFGQTLAEAMACQTPAIAFGNSGQTDIIDHKSNGYFSEYKSAEDLANGIKFILEHQNYEELAKNARKKIVENFSEKIVASKYMNLYEQILK